MLRDIALVDKAVINGFRDQDSCAAWERIKREFAEALKPSHNIARDEICRCDRGQSFLKGIRYDSDCVYCPYCGGKLSPVA